MNGILSQLKYYSNKDKYKDTIIDLEDHINNSFNKEYRFISWEIPSFTEEFLFRF